MDKLYFGTGLSSSKDYEGLYQTIRTAAEQGIYCFDTAPSYRTEEVLGNVLARLQQEQVIRREDITIQTKIDPWQMQTGNIRQHVQNALRKLGRSRLDALLIHWPVPEYLDDTWEVFCALYQEGIVKKIGICNLRTRHIRYMLKKRIPPQILQIERNPLRVCAGELALCREYGVEVQAYSPLCKMDRRIADSPALADIALRRQKSVGQIVLRWHLDTGAVPVFTSTKPERVREYADVFGFCLAKEEIEMISALNEDYKMYLESCVCPGF